MALNNNSNQFLQVAVNSALPQKVRVATVPEQMALQASDLCQRWSTQSFTKNVIIAEIISACSECYGCSTGKAPSEALACLDKAPKD